MNRNMTVNNEWERMWQESGITPFPRKTEEKHKKSPPVQRSNSEYSTHKAGLTRNTQHFALLYHPLLWYKKQHISNDQLDRRSKERDKFNSIMKTNY